MLLKLEQLSTEIKALHSKLILLVGTSSSAQTAFLKLFGERIGLVSLNVGLALGKSLAAVPQKQRPLQAWTVLRELAEEHVKGDLLLIDNIELLFDKNLQLNPLDLLKRLAHTRRVIAVWPGTFTDSRLTYAEIGHSEHQDYVVDGFVPFELK